jgi:hypothetical protein
VRERERVKVKKLREHLRNAKGLARKRAKHTRALCRAELVRARERARAQREALRADYKLASAQVTLSAREAAHRSCERSKQHATAYTADSVTRAAKHLTHELAYQRELAALAKRPKLCAVAHRKAAKEKRHESDDEVRGNISPELVPVFDKYKAKFSGSPRRSRTEHFVEWASEHQSLVDEVINADIERSVRELVKHEAATRKRMAIPAHHKQSKAKLERRLSDAALLDAVPF